MKLEQAFDVKAPLDTVWATLIDVERVAPCLPGAEITGSEDGVYHGNFQVKIGPTTAAYRGQLEMESLDEAAHVATMKARGQDKRGQGSANATIVSTLSETADGTHVEVDTDFTITGTLARFGRGGMMQDIANRLLRDFATCLEARLAAGEPAAAAAPAGEPSGEPGDAPPSAPAPAAPPAQAAPVKGISLFFSVLWERIKRFFGRGT
jgi:carbon monoxide dehydrogenase subunit G